MHLYGMEYGSADFLKLSSTVLSSAPSSALSEHTRKASDPSRIEGRTSSMEVFMVRPCDEETLFVHAERLNARNERADDYLARFGPSSRMEKLTRLPLSGGMSLHFKQIVAPRFRSAATVS